MVPLKVVAALVLFSCTFTRLLFACTWLVVAFATYLGLALVQSYLELATKVHATLLSAPAAAFYSGRYGQAALLLQCGFRADSMRRIPASAYLHTTFSFDRSICDELGTLVNILVADFVTSWYKQLTTDELFPSSVKLLLCDLLGGLGKRIQQQFHLHGSLGLATELIQIAQLHLAWFRELFVELAEAHPHAFHDDTTLHIRRQLVEAAVQNHAKLHPGCHAANNYVKHLATNILLHLRPDFNQKANGPGGLLSFSSLVWHFISELFANCVLNQIIGYCNPIYLNPLVISALAPFQVDDDDEVSDAKVKRPLQSYMASTHSNTSSKTMPIYEGAEISTQLLTQDLDSSDPGFQFSSPRSSITNALKSLSNNKPAKPRKQRSLLDVSKMKARFSRRLASNDSERATEESTASESSKADVSIGVDILQQLDQAISNYLMLEPIDFLASGRTKELHGLVSALEEILLFGFKALGDDDLSYWTYLSEPRVQTHFWNDRLEFIQSLPLPQLSDGHFSPRGVQWLLLALEGGELWDYFTAMTLDPIVTEMYYEPYAILRDKQMSNQLLHSLFRLNNLRVTIQLATLGHDRRPELLTPSSGDSLAYGITSYVEEAWESERYLPIQGWVRSSDKRKKADDRLPTSEWMWDGPWMLDEVENDSEAEDRGWQYSKTSKDVGFHSKQTMLDCIRRRKWHRVRKTLPYILMPRANVGKSPDANATINNNQEMSQPTDPPSGRRRDSVSKMNNCTLCKRGLDELATPQQHICPMCQQLVCFSCSNHCISQASLPAKQRVCTQCYDKHVKTLRLRLVATATQLKELSHDNQDVFFNVHVATTKDSHEWDIIKSWSEFQALNTSLAEMSKQYMELHDVDAGEWRRISPPPLIKRNDSDTKQVLVNRFLVELLKCHTLCQTPLVQQFFLDSTSTNEAAPMPFEKESKTFQKATRQGQLLLQKLEIHAFKFMDELFELDEMNRMRRNLLTVTRTFFRVSFHSMCHRIVDAQFTEFTHPKKIAALLFDIRSMVIPSDGVYNPPVNPPSAAKIQENTQACRSALVHACPPAFLSLLGESSARNGCLKVFEFVQHEILVKNLVFTVLDAIVQKLFPEMPPFAISLSVKSPSTHA